MTAADEWPHDGRASAATADGIADALRRPPALSVSYWAAPFTHNDELRAHRMVNVRRTSEWRGFFAYLGLQARARQRVAGRPSVVVVRVERQAGVLADAAAYAPSAKAAIDGLKDAGAWPDDSPAFVVAIVFAAPIRSNRDALTIDVHLVGDIPAGNPPDVAPVTTTTARKRRVSPKNVASRE